MKSFTISLEESNTIKGLCILIVMIHHYEQSTIAVNSLTLFRALGPIACSIFFFLSGYGLTISRSIKNYQYWIKRFMKILVPFFLSNLIYILYQWNNLIEVEDTIYYFFGIKLINDHCWFLQVLILMYIGYFIGEKYKKSYGYYFFPCLLGATYTFITKSPGMITWLSFPLGILIAQNINNITNYLSSNINIIKKSICILFIFSLWYYIDHELYLNSSILFLNFLILITSSIVCFIQVRKIFSYSKVLKYLGTHSMDFYMMHGLSLNILCAFYKTNHYLLLSSYILLTFIISTIFSLIISKIWKIIHI